MKGEEMSIFHETKTKFVVYQKWHIREHKFCSDKHEM